MTWLCTLGCGRIDDVGDDLETAAEHARLLHPDAYDDGIERWPDGAPVIDDTTLTPDDVRA